MKLNTAGNTATFDRDKIRDLLGAGLSASTVANAVGCDVSNVTHMMADATFRQEVIELRAQNLQAASKRDTKIDELEDSILDKLKDTIDGFYKPRDILMAASVINRMVRRGVAATDHLGGQQTIVNLQIPVIVQQKVVVSEKGEVVEVNGQTMVTMPAQQLLRNRAQDNKDDADKYRRIAGFLGAGVDGNPVFDAKHPDGGTVDINST